MSFFFFDLAWFLPELIVRLTLTLLPDPQRQLVEICASRPFNSVFMPGHALWLALTTARGKADLGEGWSGGLLLDGSRKDPFLSDNPWLSLNLKPSTDPQGLNCNHVTRQ